MSIIFLIMFVVFASISLFALSRAAAEHEKRIEKLEEAKKNESHLKI